MSKRNFAEDKRICDAATAPDNWFVMHDTDVDVEEPPGSGYTKGIASTYSVHDAVFIAEARAGWPVALDEIERLRTLVRRAAEYVSNSEVLAELEWDGTRRTITELIAEGLASQLCIDLLAEFPTEVAEDGA